MKVLAHINLLKLFLIFNTIFNNGICQDIFFQDIIKGGVTGGGFSSCQGFGSGNIQIYLEPNSVIKKAWLFCYKIGSETPNADIEFNNVVYNFNSSNQVSPVIDNTVSPAPNFSIHAIEVTSNIYSIQQNYPITINSQPITPCINCVYGSFYLLVIYENSTLNDVAINIFTNNKENSILNLFNCENLNPIITSYPVGFAIHSDRIGSSNDGTRVYLNSNLLGELNNVDAVNSGWGCGVKGHFYYQDNQLFGLDDDIPNFSMGGSDGLSDISLHIANNSTNFNFELEYTGTTMNGAYSNYFITFYSAYTSPCDTFATTLTEQVSVCKGEQAQLQATGGIDYEWLPEVGLSCYNCPNPIVTADSINYYTCRIWNTDSCSKVLPVKINILQPPQIQELTTYATTCGDTVGHVSISAGCNLYYNYILNDTLSQPNPHIYFLPEGNHIVSVIDTNGCRTDSTIYIASINNVSAQFSATPLEGEIPLEVSFSNQSTGANQYIWYIDEDTLYSENPAYLFDKGGEYEVTLVAIDTYPFCSDTATQKINAITPFYIFAPTITNKDGLLYEIKILNTASLTYSLYNELGQMVYNQSFENLSDGNLSLWDKTKLSRGIYLYSIQATSHDGEQKEWSGKVVVM